jgi:hypothetical protein
MMVCKICNKKFQTRKGLIIHLSKFHSNENLKEYYDKYLKNDNEGKCYICGDDAKFLSISKGYHTLCYSNDCLSKSRATGTYQFLMSKYKISKEEAIKLMNERALERGKEIKSGLDIKLNENENFHKEKSHQTKEYWIKRGYGEKESIQKSSEIMNMIHNKSTIKRKNNPDKYKDILTTQIGYWLKKGYPEKEAKEKLIERQKTFSLDKCIEKYGDKIGEDVFNKRQWSWSKLMEDKYKNGDYLKFRKELYSKDELKLFENIIEKLNIHDNVYYGKKQYYRTFKSIGKTFSYDFVYNKKVIEFNGDYWHCNPLLYKADYFHQYKQMYAKDVWKFDNIKTTCITDCGYEILIIWENEYKQNKEKTIQKCIDFINK